MTKSWKKLERCMSEQRAFINLLDRKNKAGEQELKSMREELRVKTLKIMEDPARCALLEDKHLITSTLYSKGFRFGMDLIEKHKLAGVQPKPNLYYENENEADFNEFMQSCNDKARVRE